MNSTIKRILVFRFSALGDVAMLPPVLKHLQSENKHIEFIVVSKPFHTPLFKGSENVSFYGVDLKQFKGLIGLYKLAKHLNSRFEFDAIADVHDVLRTKILRAILSIQKNINVAVINKERQEKKAFINAKGKADALKHQANRYYQVFADLGLSCQNFDSKINRLQNYLPYNQNKDFESPTKHTIGYAPFAKHLQKQLPLTKSQALIKVLSKQPDITVYLFGGGEKETQILNNWAKLYPNVQVIASQYSFEEELNIMAKINVMITMDSANMHLASLVGTPVVSIWGATHPGLGFLGLGQDEKNAIKPTVTCNPCSVFGNKKCERKDLACLYNVSIENIVAQVQKHISV